MRFTSCTDSVCRRLGQLYRPAPDVPPPDPELPDAHTQSEIPPGRDHHQPPAATAGGRVEVPVHQQDRVPHAEPHQTVSA